MDNLYDKDEKNHYASIAKVAAVIVSVMVLISLFGCTTIEGSTDSRVNIIIFGGDGITELAESKPEPVAEPK